MKAIECHRYGPPDVLELVDVDPPGVPDGGVLIRVRAAALNPLDSHLMRGRPRFLRASMGWRRPKTTRPGRDVAGTVKSVGPRVTRFKPGDPVFGSCDGALAELASTSESNLTPLPDGLSFEQAASAPVAGYTALQGLRDKGRVGPGQTVLINGAAGGVGTFAVQVAKWLGAEVTGVCSARNRDMVLSIGAGRVIDYQKVDFTAEGQRYDLVFDLVGNHSVIACRRSLKPSGTYILAGILDPRGMTGFLTFPVKSLLLAPFGRRKMALLMAKRRPEDLVLLGELMARGTIRPVLDVRRGLAAVPDALRFLESGHARGKIVIALD